MRSPAGTRSGSEAGLTSEPDDSRKSLASLSCASSDSISCRSATSPEQASSRKLARSAGFLASASRNRLSIRRQRSTSIIALPLVILKMEAFYHGQAATRDANGEVRKEQ